MKSHSRSWRRGLILLWAGLSLEAVGIVLAQQTPPAAPQQTPPAAQPSGGQAAQSAEAPPANPAAPPSEASGRSKEDLEKLVAPIALYPDSLIATILPASAYPLEIVEAARFVKDTNNLAKIDEQQWDDNVKAVARIPDVISQMDQNIKWTGDLGDAFINQPKELMDAVQAMRTKAEDSGALKTTEQQVVTVTNTVVTNVVENQTVYVTNQVTQIQPAQQDVVYVPQYNPTAVYAGAPAAYPGYTPRPIVGTALTFGAGMAVGSWINNDCDWDEGGCWGGNYHHGDADVDVNRNVNRNVNYNEVNYNKNANVNKNGQKWQPDQNRMKTSGASSSSAQSREARGYPSGTSQTANRSADVANAKNQASSANAANRTGTGEAANRASTAAANKSETGAAANRPSTAGQNAAPTGAERNRPTTDAGTGGAAAANKGTQPSSANTANRGAAGSGASAGGATANRSEGNLSPTGDRSGTAANTQQPKTPQSKPSSKPSTSSGGSAFNADNASAARSSSERGSNSRSGGGGGGGGGGGRR